MTSRAKLLLRIGLPLSVAFLSASAWIFWPSRTAMYIASSIEKQEFEKIRPIVGDAAVDDLLSHVQKLNGRDFKVHLSVDNRSAVNRVLGTQGFLIQGYDGAHRFKVTRGKVTDFRYVFISGNLEICR